MSLGNYLVDLSKQDIEVRMFKHRDTPYILRISVSKDKKINFQGIHLNEFKESILTSDDLLRLHIEQAVKGL